MKFKNLHRLFLGINRAEGFLQKKIPASVIHFSLRNRALRREKIRPFLVFDGVFGFDRLVFTKIIGQFSHKTKIFRIFIGQYL